MIITHAYPDQSQYGLEAQILLNLRLMNTEQKEQVVTLHISIYRLFNRIHEKQQRISVEAKEAFKDVEIHLDQRSLPIGGYGVFIEASTEHHHDCYMTAFDVAETPYHSIRILEQDDELAQERKFQDRLIRHHFNYYLMHSKNLFEVFLSTFQTGAHLLSAVDVEGWWQDYYERHLSWQAFGAKSKEGIGLYDLLEEEDYKYKIIKRMCKKHLFYEENMIKGMVVNIEGVDYEAFNENVLDEFRQKDTALFVRREYYWPIENYDIDIQKALILRVKKPFCTYYHLKNIILEGKYFSHYKPVVVEPVEQNHQEQQSLTGYKLLMATIVSNGGYMLIKTSLLKRFNYELEPYSRFMIQYKDIFYDENALEISKSFYGYREDIPDMISVPFSIAATTQKVWMTVKETAEGLALILINIMGNDNNWSGVKVKPKKTKKLKFRLPIEFSVGRIYWDSPDFDHKKPRSVDYKVLKQLEKQIVEFTLKELKLWTIVYLEKSKEAPPQD